MFVYDPHTHTRSRIQAAEISFLRRVASISLRDRVKSSIIRERLGVGPLLLHLERSQLRWFGHLVRMPPRRLPREVLALWENTPGQTKDQMEGLHLQTGLGTPRDRPGGSC